MALLGAWTHLLVRPEQHFMRPKLHPGVTLPYENRVALSEKKEQMDAEQPVQKSPYYYGVLPKCQKAKYWNR